MAAPVAPVAGVLVFEDLFEVHDKDPEGKKFDKVSRFHCRSNYEAECVMDINVDIYKLEVSVRARATAVAAGRRCMHHVQFCPGVVCELCALWFGSLF